MHSMLILLLILALAGPALAVDGVAEINQTCAVQTGCFGGDAAGYPVTIDGTAGTSYRLTGAKKAHNRTTATASPPGRWPNRARNRRISRCRAPPSARI